MTEPVPRKEFDMTEFTQRTQVKLPAPFKVEDLDKFFQHTPPGADVTVVTREGGSQRDPYPTGYVFTATWSVEPEHG